jgi:anti-anti-sigma factor
MNLVTTVSPVGLKLTGEIDATNAHLVDRALREHAQAGRPLHLDLSELSFCDVAGLRAVVSFAQRPGGDRRLVLHGMPAQIEKVMNVMGWAELPGLEFCACEVET